MALFKPFKGIRPVRDKVHLIASRSFVTYSKRQLDYKLATNPYSFIHIINPEWGQTVTTKPNSKEKFKLVKNKFNAFKRAGYFTTEQTEVFYLYKQDTPTNSFTGFIGCNSMDDYFNDVIKKHESTLHNREEVFKSYLDVCQINAEPVLIGFPDDSELESIVTFYQNQRPEYDFSTSDLIRHQVWIIDKSVDIKKISERFSKFNALYIADGHHRCASSALLCTEKRNETKNYSGNEPFNYVMSYLVPESQLKIWDYNRLIKDMNGLSASEFLKKIEKDFEIHKLHLPEKPKKIHEFTMYLNKTWYLLKLKKMESLVSLDSLDSAILTKKVLAPLFDITDLRTSKRIGFISGNVGIKELEEKVDSGKFAIGFALFPVSITQMKSIADQNAVMPPKSTWVEPKLRSGLIIYQI